MLDNPVWAALTGPHSHLAEWQGQVVRYPGDVAPFFGLAAAPVGAGWQVVAEFAGHGEVAQIGGPDFAPPRGWGVELRLPGVQLVGTEARGAVDPECVRLGPEDVPEMLDLVARTDPGPFRDRTIALGAYYGFGAAGSWSRGLRWRSGPAEGGGRCGRWCTPSSAVSRGS